MCRNNFENLETEKKNISIDICQSMTNAIKREREFYDQIGKVCVSKSFLFCNFKTIPPTKH